MKTVPSRAPRVLGAALLPLALLCLLRPGAAVQGPPPEILEQLRYPKTVVLVRHAEKESGDAHDPALSEQGLSRAQELARVLGGAGVTHLYASEFRRTHATLEPLSLVSGAAVQSVPARDPAALVSAIGELPRESLAVVAGHSNTLPELVRRLAPEREGFVLGDEDYDRLWVVTLTGSRGPALVVELRYGAP
jgi:broad specificity phosphatase PhoE